MTEYSALSLKRQLKKAREYREKSKVDIAGAVGVKLDTYDKWERVNANSPSHEKLALIANYLKVDISFFFLSTMTPEEADLEKRTQRDALLIMADKIAAIEEKVEPKKGFDENAHLLKVKPSLRGIFDLIKDLDEAKLSQLLGAVKMFLIQKDTEESAGDQEARRGAG